MSPQFHIRRPQPSAWRITREIVVPAPLRSYARSRQRERGMVTAEMAVALTAVMGLFAALLWVIAVVGMQVRCVDAARDVARAAARGDSVAASKAAGNRSAPDGAEVRLRSNGEWVEARVGVDARPPWPLLERLPAIPVEGDAAVALEPGEAPEASAGRAPNAS